MSSLPAFYDAHFSRRSHFVFSIVFREWQKAHQECHCTIDVPIDAPPAIWRAISGAFPKMSHDNRRKLLAETLDLVLEHERMCLEVAEGTA